MAKIIKNDTSRDPAVFEVAYLTDLHEVENTISTRIDGIEESIGFIESSIASDEGILNSLVTDMMDAQSTINSLVMDLGSITTALGAGYNQGTMNFEGMGTYISEATDITQALIALDRELGYAPMSIADTVSWVTDITNNLGSFWHDGGWGVTEDRYWSFSDPETHYLSAVTSEYGPPTLTDALIALDTAIYNAGTAGAVTLSARATAETGYASTYDLHQGGVLKGSINIPKDFLVKSAALSTVTTADVPYAGAKVGDKYIDFVINAKDASATAEHIYLPVNDLVDVYTAQANATQVQLAIDSNNVISATIVAGSVGTTELANNAVTTAKIANRAVNSDKIGLVDSATNKLYTIQVASGRLQLAEIAAD